MEAVQIDDPRFGIVVYKSSLKEEVARVLECELSTSTHNYFKWNPATVGYFETPAPDYRKCWDCKIGPSHVGQMPAELEDIYLESAKTIKSCVDDYAGKQNIHPMQYMEAINFVKYGIGEHFAPHNDHGFTYVSTISTVTYLNDNYEGGELEFSKLGFKIKPEAGDIVVFPSTYIYTHASLPVTSGIKYAAVTMFDYTDKWHKFHAAEPPSQLPPTFHTTPDVLCGNFNLR